MCAVELCRKLRLQLIWNLASLVFVLSMKQSGLPNLAKYTHFHTIFAHMGASSPVHREDRQMEIGWSSMHDVTAGFNADTLSSQVAGPFRHIFWRVPPCRISTL